MIQDVYTERIINGAAELFRLYGIRAVTMDMLAQHLGVSKRTIYEKFSDKDELLAAVIQQMVRKQKQMTEDILDSSPNVINAIFRMIVIMREHSRGMNQMLWSDLKKYHGNVLEGMKEKCEIPDYSSTMDIILRGIKQGLFREDLDSEIVNRGFQGLGQMMMDADLFPAEKYHPRDIIRNVMVNYLRGISTRKGLKIIDELEPEL